MVYDLIVIGGGPAGYRSAERAGKAGLLTLCVEKDALGGVCLNEGCIPTKTLLYSAKLYNQAQCGEKYGVAASGVSMDHQKVILRKDKLIKILVAGVKSALASSNVTLVYGEAKILGKSNGHFTVQANDETYLATHLLIAAGSAPVIPPIKGLREAMDASFAITSREALSLASVPQKLAVIGGGVIGLEIAAYYGAAGSEVTIIEALGRIGGEHDAELASLLQKALEKRGVIFKLESRVTAIEDGGVHYEQNGQTHAEHADKVLLCVGRRAESSGLGLETIGALTERGAVVTDERMQTNVPRVYAAGDVNGKRMLAHAAYREADVAINNILGKEDTINYNAIPSVIYTDPELAGVGETEATAAQKGIDFAAVSLPMRFSGRYMAENEGGSGMIKLLMDNTKGTLIGAHALSNYSSEFIAALASYIELEIPVDDIRKIAFPHPTVGEIIRDALERFGG